MESHQILAANYLDILFDGRNKAYGAYYLRQTYDKRMKQSLACMFILIGIFIIAVSFTKKTPVSEDEQIFVVTAQLINDLPKEKPEQPRPKEQPKPLETVAKNNELINPKVFITPTIAPEVIEATPTQEELGNSVISNTNKKGTDGPFISQSAAPGSGKETLGGNELVQSSASVESADAVFDGDWAMFLYKNLRAEKAVDEGAEAGTYKVQIRFMVDTDGSISNLQPLTSIGYGLEEEAIRAIKKSKKWIAAMQNGIRVKAYRIQTISFVVQGEN